MTLVDVLVIFAVLGILGGAVTYIIKEKKRGKKCIGCPYSEGCNGGCGSHSQNK